MFQYVKGNFYELSLKTLRTPLEAVYNAFYFGRFIQMLATTINYLYQTIFNFLNIKGEPNPNVLKFKMYPRVLQFVFTKASSMKKEKTSKMIVTRADVDTMAS